AISRGVPGWRISGWRISRRRVLAEPVLGARLLAGAVRPRVNFVADRRARAHTGLNATSCKEATWASMERSDLIPRSSIG
ncbi:hypothetical protein ATCCBAA256_07150, partial [Mycobacterium montefiorense]